MRHRYCYMYYYHRIRKAALSWSEILLIQRIHQFFIQQSCLYNTLCPQVRVQAIPEVALHFGLYTSEKQLCIGLFLHNDIFFYVIVSLFFNFSALASNSFQNYDFCEQYHLHILRVPFCCCFIYSLSLLVCYSALKTTQPKT